MTTNTSAKHILLLHPNTGEEPFYLNPIEMQRIGALAAVSYPDYETSMLDLRLPHDRQTWADSPQTHSVICISTPAGSTADIAELIATTSLRGTSEILLFGEIVTDGHADKLLSELGQQTANIHIFVGRNEKDFLKIMDGILHNPLEQVEQSNEPHVAIHSPASIGLPSVAENTQIAFPQAILEQAASRGLQVLHDGITRGCEHHCGYCHLNNSAVTSGRVQYLSKSNISTIVGVSHAIPRPIISQLTDENFFGGHSDVEKLYRFASIENFCRGLKEQGFSGYLGVDTRCDTIINPKESSEIAAQREAAWEAMSAAGLRYVYLGIETFSPQQSKRYGKALNLSIVPEALNKLTERGISFTAGLIAIDPLMTPEDVRTNLDYISTHNLFSNIASLLKDMRVHVRSPYYRLMQQKMKTENISADNLVYLNPDAVPYHDEKIASVMPTIRRIHRLFSRNGYRHSDIAAYEALKSHKTAPDNTVPYVIGKMECAVWRYLLDNDPNDEATKDQLLGIVTNAIDQTATAMRHIDTRSDGDQKLYEYYQNVFHNVSKSARNTIMSGGTKTAFAP